MNAGALLVVAGEASGDLHASHVLAQLKRLRPDLRVAGVGGDLCVAQGMDVRVHCRDLAVMGVTEVLWQWRRIRTAFQACLAFVDQERPAAALLIDYGGFNLRLAAELKKRGVCVLYYISPKVWAWGSRRIPTMRRLIDRLLVIFPFEVAYFQKHGIAARYVGNPSVDELATPPQRQRARQDLGIADEATVVTLMPGSRRNEIRRLLGLMMKTAGRLALVHPGVRFLVPRAPTVPLALLGPAVDALRAQGVTVTVVEGGSTQALAAANVAVVASGTAVLETALVGTPQVVVYRAGWVTALLVKALVRLKWVNPVNILAQREVVPELLQWAARPARVAREVRALLDGPRAEQMRQDYRALREELGQPGAPLRVAQEVVAALDRDPEAAPP